MNDEKNNATQEIPPVEDFIKSADLKPGVTYYLTNEWLPNTGIAVTLIEHKAYTKSMKSLTEEREDSAMVAHVQDAQGNSYFVFPQSQLSSHPLMLTPQDSGMPKEAVSDEFVSHMVKRKP